MSEIPRVTEILNPFNSYSAVPSDVLARAAARGTTVHSLCAGIAGGAWIPHETIDEGLRGYVKSFMLWQKERVHKFLVIEKRYNNQDLMYSGQVDYVIESKTGEIWLVDLKTSSAPQKTHPVQIAAYQDLLNKAGMNTCGGVLVYLSKEGEFPKEYVIADLSAELRVFTSALECWKYFKTSKRRGTKFKATKVEKDSR